MGATKAVGVDNDPKRVAVARKSLRDMGFADRSEVILGDFYEMDLSDATLVTLCTVEALGLQAKLLRSLKPGTRVVSYSFGIGDWKPDATQVVMGRCMSLWIVPAHETAIRFWEADESGGPLRFEDIRREGLVLKQVTEEDLDLVPEVTILPPGEQEPAPLGSLKSSSSVSVARKGTFVGATRFAAILENWSEKSVCALAVEWRYQSAGRGCSGRSWAFSVGTASLPFTVWHRHRQWVTFPPRARGLLFSKQAAAFCTCRSRDAFWDEGVLRLDGVFFTDDTFVGPNQLRVLEEICFYRNAFDKMAHFAARRQRERRDFGVIANEIEGFFNSPNDNFDSLESDSIDVAVRDIWRRRLVSWCERTRLEFGDEGLIKCILLRNVGMSKA
jgi:hypothetical protein